MQVVVLAGGFGTRLRPWTSEIPKPILPMLDKTLLEHVVEVVPSGKVDEVVIAGGYKVDDIEEYFNEADVPYDVRIVKETEPLGTGGALGNCRDVVSGQFVCLNGDIISSLDMQVGLDLHQKNGGIGTLALWEVEDPTRFGIVGLDDDQRITQFKEKPAPEEVFSNLINAGSYLFEDDIFDYIPMGRSSLEREVFPILAKERELNGFSFDGYFIDAGTPKSWSLGVEASITHQRWKSGKRIDSNWHADNSIDIHGDSKVENSMLSTGASIMSAHLSKCSLLNNVRVGSNSKLNETLIGRNSTIGENCTLDNVVVDHNSIVPDNTVLSNAQWPLIE
ncbi:MAG: sugar phosphate nucleotidyltransferase [Candidatus Thermoplasmatota archaeon]|nr:sugar phosphate nucleotidyltransferase [Candidatus Thermoplasmatota archaeon]